jgi:DNA polymerase-1
LVSRLRERSGEPHRQQLGVKRFTEKLNTPVQGTGADGLKFALALLWERRDQAPGAFPVLAVHGEIVVECDAGRAGAAAGWLKAAMVEAMTPLTDPVPVEVGGEGPPDLGRRLTPPTAAGMTGWPDSGE